MKTSTAIAGVIAASSTFFGVNGAPAAANGMPSPDLLRRQTGSVAITGVTGQAIAPRKEIRTLQANADQFTLYVLALRRIMDIPSSQKLSYYQVAGIHGRPFVAWDGQTSRGGASGYNAGYCTHTSNIFLPWHRPYLALYEQLLYQAASDIAASYPQDRRQRYQNALTGFRLPYWDWAAPPNADGSTYPAVFGQAYISVDTPDVGQQSRPNPLYRYVFDPSVKATTFRSGDALARNDGTLRQPSTPISASSTSNDGQVASNARGSRRNWADRVYNLMSNQRVFNAFSNSAFSGGLGNADSIESIHNEIHVSIGGSGHMAYPEIAGFDPIFYAHHTNIDRLWAIWSTLNPNTYVQRALQRGATYTIPANTYTDANTLLTPFSKNTNSQVFTSNDVRTTTPFNYNYPELAPGATTASINAAINALYGPNANQAASKKMKRAPAAAGSEYHYVTNIATPKSGLGGSYSVNVFLGQVRSPDNARAWPAAPEQVGAQGVFTNDVSGDDVPITGTVPLTSSLKDKVASGQLANLEPDTVSKYLKDNLSWRVAKADGTIVPNNQVQDLEVSVVYSTVKPSTDKGKLPEWSKFTVLPSVTEGKDGGHKNRYWKPDN